MDKFYNKIEELYTLQANWDGYGAREVSALSIKNLILLKKKLDEWDFDLWQIAPGVNGDIFINYKGSVPAAIIINGIWKLISRLTVRLNSHLTQRMFPIR